MNIGYIFMGIGCAIVAGTILRDSSVGTTFFAIFFSGLGTGLLGKGLLGGITNG